MEFIKTKTFHSAVDQSNPHALEVCTPPYFLNDVVMYYGRNVASIDESDLQVASGQVQELILNLSEQLEQDVRFSGRILQCGSIYEGTKVRKANEYDYVKELSGLHPDDLILEHVTPDTVRSRTQTNQPQGKSFVRIRFKAEVPEEWRSCMRCKNCSETDHCQPNHQPQYINPRLLQQEFADAVSRAIRGRCDEDGRVASGDYVTINGPAISFCCQAMLDMDFPWIIISDKQTGIANWLSTEKYNCIIVIAQYIYNCACHMIHWYCYIIKMQQ